jgi:hypothetical protein
MKDRCLFLMVMIFVLTSPAVLHSATFYVAKTGNDRHSCSQAQSISQPMLTIASGISCMKAGDTLVIEQGTYAEGIHDTLPAGTSASNRTKLVGLNGARWTLRPGNASQCYNGSGALYVNNKSYIEIADMILDGTNCTGGAALYWLNGASSDHILRDSELKNLANGTGLLFQGGHGSRHAVINVVSHHHGNDSFDHCFYPTGSDHVFDGVEGYNCSGHGMHFWHTKDGTNNRNIIKQSSFHNNGSWGIGIYRGSDNQVFRNTLVNNGIKITPSGGLRISAHATKAYNNTIYDHGQAGRCIRVESLADGSIVRNNLCLSNANNTISDAGTNTIATHNHSSTDGALVMDAPNGRFYPRVNSALIDAGTGIGLPSGISYVGSAPDQGALEFIGMPIGAPLAPVNLRVSP